MRRLPPARASERRRWIRGRAMGIGRRSRIERAIRIRRRRRRSWTAAPTTNGRWSDDDGQAALPGARRPFALGDAAGGVQLAGARGRAEDRAVDGAAERV